jgi:hypothetical protein
MATTTNYGWTTPDDTSLVKDGASAIRTLGTAIDTTTYNNSLLPIVKTIVDAKGDIIAATAADTVSRLAVGANDTVLTADSTAATGLKWATPAAGSMTLLSTTTLSGASTTISSINQTYKHLFFIVTGITTSVACRTNFKPNSTTSLVHNMVQTSNNATVANFAANSTFLRVDVNGNQLETDANNARVILIYDYASTARYKTIQTSGFYTSTLGIALMQGAPHCDVVIAGHVGFDGLDTFGGMLRHLEQGNVRCVMWFRRIARTDIPTENMAAWLDQQWLMLDTEVKKQNEVLKGMK